MVECIFIFKDTSHDTLQHWRAFSEKHLLDSDRLTRNLYDLRQLTELPDEAIQVAIQVNSDPSTRNIRLAVVVGNQSIRQSVEKIEDLTIPAGLELSIFNSIEEAEIWLDRPLTLLV
jgi:hypothetical protein